MNRFCAASHRIHRVLRTLALPLLTPLLPPLLTPLPASLLPLAAQAAAPSAAPGAPVLPELRFKNAFEVGGQPTCGFIQDRDGFLWIGSLWSGLTRFDGQETRVYKAGAQALASNYVTFLFEDSRGLIWISTNAGLNVYDKATGKFGAYYHDPKDPGSLADDHFGFSAAQITEDAQGRLWFATHGGLSRLDPGARSFQNYRHQEAQPGSIASDGVSAVLADAQGGIWLAYGDHGLDRLDAASGRVEHFRHDARDARSLPHDDIIGIAAGRDGLLWLTSQHNGLIRFDPRNRSFKAYSHEKGNPYGLPKLVGWGWKQLANGLLTPLQSTASIGLVLFDPVAERTTVLPGKPGRPFSIASGGVQGVIEDGAGRLWLALSSGTVQVYDPKAVPLKLFHHEPEDAGSLASNQAIPIYEDREGRIWIGHFGGGLDLLEPGASRFRHFTSQPGNPRTLPHNYPAGFLEDERGTFYVSTFSGMVVFDRRRMEVTEHLTRNTTFYALRQDPDQPDLIWASGWDAGLCSIHRVTHRMECLHNQAGDPSSLSNDTALRMVMLRGEPKYLWLATWGGGLERFERRTRSFTHFTTRRDDPQSISSNTVFDLHQDRQGRVWLGTANGLNLFDPARHSFTRFTADSGFPASAVHNIQEDQGGDLWLASDAGLIRFDPQARVVRRIFTTEDGAHSNEFFASSGLATRDGRLFFGGLKGLNLLRPGDMQANAEAPRVYLTALRQDGRDLPQPRALEHVRALEFDAEHNGFEFDFVAQGFTNAAQNRYAYRLEGLETAWQQVGHRRTGRYSNLPAGDFTLHIRAANNDGVWNEEGLRIAVRVVPPFWRTLPFYLLCGMLAAGLGFGAYRLRVMALRRSNAQLEVLVHRRTRELQAAQQRANDAAEAKSMFLANMSHEIRTPMNAIIGLAHLVSCTELSARQRDYLRKIEQSGHHLLGILNDILDFSKVESGKLRIERVPFTLDTLLQEVVTVIAPKAQGKGLEFICSVEPGVPQHLLGDPLRLAQILINYLNNAVKFTARGEVQLQVQAAPEPGDAAGAGAPVRLRFTVRDSGIGLSETQRAQLFQSFSQADASTTRKFGGTGLGLAISKRLAEQMGGAVGVQSEPGQGARFWFTALLQPNPDPAAARPRRADLHAQRILVVDDHPVAAQVLAHLAAQLGARAELCLEGPQAVQRLRQAAADGDPFAVVLLDWQMPQWDGIETARQIRALALSASPRIIIVTCHGRDEVFQAAQQAGLHEILAKPVGAATLLETLAHAAGEAPAAPWPGTPRGGAFARLAPLRGARILLVEDNPLNQQVASELLQMAGLAVDIADHGGAALERVAQRRYDLVLMDMQMPVMDGLTATRRLRADPANAALPIIAMTANAMQSDRERCLAAGMNGFVAKPIEPEQLEAALLEWIVPRPGLGAGHGAESGTHPGAEPGADDGAQATALTQALAGIAGLDVAQGLQHMAGNARLYRELAQGFCASQAGTARAMREALRADAPDLLERLAHTLKGLAGNLGAVALQAQAAQLEALAHGPGDSAQRDAALDALEPALLSLVQALQAALPRPAAAPAPAAPGAPGALQARVQELAQLVQEEDAEALALLHAQRADFEAALGPHYAALAAALEQYDFDAARAALQQAARACEPG